jgi:hypothetical protein
MIRVARHSVVLLTVDSMTADSYWLIRDYFPEGRDLFAPLSDLLAMLPGATAHTVMIPEDCHDGFVQAFWKRPHALLDPRRAASATRVRTSTRGLRRCRRTVSAAAETRLQRGHVRDVLAGVRVHPVRLD